jgi:hypothetical protein
MCPASNKQLCLPPPPAAVNLLKSGNSTAPDTPPSYISTASGAPRTLLPPSATLVRLTLQGSGTVQLWRRATTSAPEQLLWEPPSGCQGAGPYSFGVLSSGRVVLFDGQQQLCWSARPVSTGSGAPFTLVIR